MTPEELDGYVHRTVGTATPRNSVQIWFALRDPIHGAFASERDVRQSLFRLERAGKVERVRVPGRYRGTLSKTLHWRRAAS